MTLRDRIERRAVPRLVVALSTFDLLRRLEAAVRRARGGRGTVDLYVAFDDPLSAVATLGLAQRTAHRAADIRVHPVVTRGIPDDPAADAKRAYAVTDARRLAARDGLVLARTTTLDAGGVAFLAGWTESVPDGDARLAFAVAAMRRLWCETGDDTPTPEAYADLYRAHATGEPPGATGALTAEATMRKRGLYDTPIAVVHGRWFFAHERLHAIEHRLDDLGWRAVA